MEIMVLNQRLLRIIGYHYEDFWRFPKILWSAFWFLLATFNILPMILFLSDSRNVYGASEGMSVLPSFIISALKITFYVRKLHIIHPLMRDLKENVRRQSGRHETSASIFAAAEKHLSILTTLFFLSLVSCILFYCAVPFGIHLYHVLSGAPYDFMTPLSVQFPFPIEWHPLFDLLYFVCGCSVAFQAMFMISMDTVFVGLVLFCAAHYTDLMAQIQRTADHDPRDERRAERALLECVSYHKRITGYVNLVQEAMSASVFVQYMGSTLLLCMIIFQTTVSTRVDNIPVYASFLCGCITQLFMYSFYGTYLTEEGHRVAVCIYSDFSWYEYSPRTRKLLLLFLLRTQQPVKLTALKVFDCSLTTFVMIYKTSMSALALLQSFTN